MLQVHQYVLRHVLNSSFYTDKDKGNKDDYL